MLILQICVFIHVESSIEGSSSGGNGVSSSTVSSLLPWGARKEHTQFPPTVHVDTELRPGEFVMRTLFAEFTVTVEKKIENVMQESLVSHSLIMSLLLYNLF